jgi:hypothetical protein
MHKDRKGLIFGGNTCNIKRWWKLDNRKIEQKYCKMGETHLKPPSFSSKMGITCDFFVWIGHMCVTKPKRGQVLTNCAVVGSKWYLYMHHKSRIFLQSSVVCKVSVSGFPPYIPILAPHAKIKGFSTTSHAMSCLPPPLGLAMSTP